ncbi:MAG TPA: hypothetical protein DD490_27615, partial [Acidobacteria bacterium]|nr:hypothetical protein [Acidobacteriota bacterium]
DNFFDLGGHSLLMVRVQSRLRDTCAREVPMLDLFQHPTVGALARHLGTGGEEATGRASLVAGESRGESRRARAGEQQLQRRRRRLGRTGDDA